MMISSFFLDGLAQASEQLCGKAVGANWRPAFERASRLALACGIVLSAALGALLYMRNGMLVSLAVFIAAALALAPFGNLGLWAALHIWLLSRGAIYWWALERRKPALFVA
jgi:MATE family multidrug resistance protein